jgi:PD-(D/E)XK nuclease superfamily
VTLQVSASKSELLLQCGRPFEEGVETHDEPSEAAAYGSAFHALMEAKTTRREFLLPAAKRLEVEWELPNVADELADHVIAAKKLLRRWLGGENPWKTVFDAKRALREAAFAINPHNLTVRRIDGPDANHVYHGLYRGEIPGTVDLLIFPGGKGFGPTSLLMDYKTGRDPFDFLTIPEDVTQLRTLGLIPWLNPPPLCREEVILSILHAPRGQPPAIYADLVPSETLSQHAEKLAAAHSRAGDGSLRAGPCCRLCAARHDCITQTGAFLREAGEMIAVGSSSESLLAEAVADPHAIATADDVGRLHLFVKRFEKLAASASGLMKEWVVNHPNDIVVRPDGRVLIIKERSYEGLSKASIIRALGKTKGESLIESLRAQGVVEQGERLELHAVDDR